ncbi:MAG: patatin-like phospholipase family protein [Ilumatobacteraceae bacterium]
MPGTPRDAGEDRTAFVLGGGGQLGAHEVGMLQALVERGIQADVVVGTSIGAVNGALYAADPTADSVRLLAELWSSGGAKMIFGESLADSARLLAKSTTHLFRNDRFRAMLADAVPDTFEDLRVPFECVAANIETSSAHYLSSGPLVDALLASSAVPGLFQPVEIDGHHYLDGGLVNSIPLDRGLALGATELYVLQVGRVEEPLVVPSKPWEVAAVAFEISRRHRFVEALASVPAGVRVHVLPTGEPKSFNDLGQYRPAPNAVDERIERSYRATLRYLDSPTDPPAR